MMVHLHSEFLRIVAVSAVTSAMVGLVLAIPVYRLLLRMGSKQTVSQHLPEHQGKQGTPTMGGILVLLAALGGLFASGVPWLPAALALGLFGLIGFLDDFIAPRMFNRPRGLAWKEKLVLQFLAALACTYFIAPAGEGGFTDRNWWQWAIGVFVVLFLTNAYNFADGLDGLAGSLGIGLAAGFCLLSILFVPDPAVAAFCGSLGGGLVAFLFLNAPPAKVFMGDVGSLPIGALFGVIALIASRPSPIPYQLFADQPMALWPSSRSVDWGLVVATVLLCGVMIAELVPVPLQILSVKLRKKKLFLRTPIHHAFEARGVPESKIVWWFALTQLLLVGVAGLAAIYLRPGAD